MQGVQKVEGAAVLSHFLLFCSIPIIIDNCHLIVCAMSCVCVGLVGVCCVISSDEVWGVGDAVCVLLSIPIHIDDWLLIVACTMSCVCVWLVGVCCVMSSDEVWGVDDAVCVSLSTPKKDSAAHCPV